MARRAGKRHWAIPLWQALLVGFAALLGAGLAKSAGAGGTAEGLVAALVSSVTALLFLGPAYRRGLAARRLQLIAETGAGAEMAFSPEGRLLWVSPAIASLSGYSADECVAAPDLINLLVDELDRGYAREQCARAMAGETGQSEMRLRHRHGGTVWVTCFWRPVRDDAARLQMIRMSIVSDQARKATELQLLETVAALRRAQGLSEHYLSRNRDERQRLQALLDVIELGILFVDADRRVRYANPALLRIWGFGGTGENMLGVRDARLLAEAMAQIEAAEAYRVHVDAVQKQRGRSEPFELRLLNGRRVQEVSAMVTAEGSTRSLGRLWVFEDVTEQRRASEDLVRLAERDPLTNLYNRRRFHDALESSLAGAQRGQTQIGLMMFDLDGFKPINDELGHQTGDEVLVAVAVSIRRVVRRNEQLFRVGGDEFAILIAEANELALQELAQRVVTEVAGIKVAGASISASVGYACYPEDASSVDALVAAADSAMYRAKSAGKNCWQTCAARGRHRS